MGELEGAPSGSLSGRAGKLEDTRETLAKDGLEYQEEPEELDEPEGGPFLPSLPGRDGGS